MIFVYSEMNCPTKPDRNDVHFIQWLLISITIVILIPVGFFSGIITKLCCSMKRKRTASPFYDYIVASKDKKIATASNKCYATNKGPELPKSRDQSEQ